MSTGFVVLPDGCPTDTTWLYESPQVITHPSGRPWLVGRWGADEIVQAQAGSVRVVVIGHCPVTTTQLTRLAERVCEQRDVGPLARQLPGSHHLIVTSPDGTSVRGTITGLRQVFHTRVDGHAVASDRPDTLALLTGAGVDEGVLAARLATGGRLPAPLGTASVWSGISAVPDDHCLIMEGERAREVRWWQAPEPELPLEEGAPAVHAALSYAVRSRTSSRHPVTADLSGGMDSTALCFLAARSAHQLLTFRWGEADAGNDDAMFAAHSAALLVQASHMVVPQHELPALFAHPGDLADTEQPYPFTRTLARMKHTVGLLADRGSRTHFAGHGADELFGRFPGYLHRLLRRQPRLALRHLRGYQALNRWPLRDMLAQLARADSVQDWWRAEADSLTNPAPALRQPPLAWGLMPLRAPVWVTESAVDAARSQLRTAAETASPFADDRGQHQFLVALRATAPAYRQFARLFDTAGIRLHQPYLDDRVVEAALAVRMHERCTPWEYKPLLAAAMRDTLPERVRTRTTKGSFDEDLRAGLHRSLDELLELFADSELARAGLISSDVVRSQLLTPQANLSGHFAVEQLLGCETWFRAARHLGRSERRQKERERHILP
ncbi:asparagine synthase-related protein [Streptomyces sp. NPDC052036]|uniref:asparagine synthase-related protein n=1 Tax=Streptomyces sp. NPDC052036 TaxID=3155171 RepID=UPI00342253CF